MSRAILIVGTGRSGTSALAGAIHELGVHFCDHVIGPHPEHNPLGHYECRQWWEVGRRDQYPAVSEYERLIETHERPPVWAIKDTWVRWGLHEVVPLMDDPRIIASHRQFAASIRSRTEHTATVDPAQDMVRRAHNLFAFLSAVHVPVLHVDYERLIADTSAAITEIARFIYEGLEEHAPTPRRLAAAAQFIDPTLNHHSMPEAVCA